MCCCGYDLGDCCKFIIQALITALSCVSSLAIIDVFNVSSQIRATIIISTSCVSIPFICGKNFCEFIECLESGTQSTEFNILKQVLGGLVDATFDIIAGIAILNNIGGDEYQQSYILFVGTFIGLGSQIVELVIECIDDYYEKTHLIIGVLQYIAAIVQIAFGIYLATLVDDIAFEATAIVFMSILLFGLCCGGICIWSCR